MILDEIIENKTSEVEISKTSLPLEQIQEQIKDALPSRNFFDAISCDRL